MGPIQTVINAQKKIKQDNWGTECMQGDEWIASLAGEFREVVLEDDYLTKT